MEAECTVSGTANCVGLSVPNFMLRQEESSSCSCMLLLNTLQSPFPSTQSSARNIIVA